MSTDFATSISRRYEFDNPDYVKNDRDRCFHCKDELFTRLISGAGAADRACRLWSQCRRSRRLSAGTTGSEAASR